MKENFYIFLDIDGVLWDWKYRISAIKEGKASKSGIISSFNPESIDALNNLIALLDQNFSPELVISSTWRENMFATKKALYKNGLEFDKPINCTPRHLNPFFRGKEILEYLDSVGHTENYVVIDDGSFDFSNTLNKNNIIKTNIASGSLTNSHIKKYISSHPEITEEKETTTGISRDFPPQSEESSEKI